MNHQLQQLTKLIEAAEHIAVIQAENPDGDSLASSLALEGLLTNLDKKVTMFCHTQVPRYLQYIQGWDRVVNELPRDIDLAIVVDMSNFDLLQATIEQNRDILGKTPLAVLDHHDSEANIEFENVLVINDPGAAATSQLIYRLIKHNNWPLDKETGENIATAVLADTLGLMTDKVSAETMYLMADLVEMGVSLEKLNEARLEYNRRPQEIVKYKGKLLQRIEFHHNGTIGTIVIPLEEIKEYSDKHNPSMLAIEEMLMTQDLLLAVSFKIYEDYMTGKIRCNAPVGRNVAEHFGGGGHPKSAGCRIEGADIEKLQQDFITVTAEEIDKWQANPENYEA